MATAEQELTEVRRLRDRTRSRAHGGVWFPVAVLALLLLTSIALYRSPFRELHEATVTVPYWAGLPAEQRSPIASYRLWLVGAGLGALAALAIIAAVPVELSQDVPLGTLTSTPPPAGTILRNGLLTPLLPIGIAIAVLGLVEGSRALVLAGGWVALIAWFHCTFGVTSVFHGGPSLDANWRYHTLPGPLLVAIALPLLAFAAVRAWRVRGGMR